MINLLPPDKKSSIAYARRNTALIGWLVTTLLSLAGVVAIVLFGLIYLNRSIDAHNQQLTQSREQLKVQKLEETQKQVEGISSDLKLVVQVLNKEILFSKLLQQIGAAMPPNTILTNLSISKVQGGIDLQAGATDYNAATQVQVNLSDSNNKIFEKADIVSIQCTKPNSTSTTTTEPTTNSKYPCTVTIRAKFAANNSFTLTAEKKQ